MQKSNFDAFVGPATTPAELEEVNRKVRAIITTNAEQYFINGNHYDQPSNYSITAVKSQYIELRERSSVTGRDNYTLHIEYTNIENISTFDVPSP